VDRPSDRAGDRMSDLGWTAIWLGALVGGVVACVGVRALGVASTYVRDLLHVGAGIWLLGWPAWHGHVAPIAIVGAVAVGTLLVPQMARRIELVARFQRSVSGGDERWGGLILYTLSYALLTAVGMTGQMFPAAAGLAALSLGDGVGGAVGRRFGEHRYRPPWGKSKSLEGSVIVGAAAAVAVLIVAAVCGVDLSVNQAVTLGMVAAISEGLAPRGTDNAVVPAAVWGAALLIT